MFVRQGDTVILARTDQPLLKDYLNTRWEIKAVMLDYHPASAIITKDDIQASTFVRNLEVVPPADAVFEHNESVKIIKCYDKYTHYTCRSELVGKIGRIRSYDSRNEFFNVYCSTGDAGWFPGHCLCPLDYKGERFYYPLESVLYKNKISTITKIKKSKFKWGQVLLINGCWVPSTDVEPIK
jgi:hypothetical protein